MFTSEMMKRVHEIASNLEGDYSARLVLAFREVLNTKEFELEGTEKQIAWATDLRAKMLGMLVEELERNYFLERISSLEEDTTIYDIFLLVDSNYNYLIELLKNKDIDISEINKLRLFVYNPYNYILNNILCKKS